MLSSHRKVDEGGNQLIRLKTNNDEKITSWLVSFHSVLRPHYSHSLNNTWVTHLLWRTASPLLIVQKQHHGQQPAPSQPAALSLRASEKLQFSFLDWNCLSLSQQQLCTPSLKGSTIPQAPQCSSVIRMLLNLSLIHIWRCRRAI